jgi:hypothetical protein
MKIPIPPSHNRIATDNFIDTGTTQSTRSATALYDPAVFDLASPLLIRSEEPLTNDDHQPDVSHLRDGAGRPIISGTSLAGVLRGRAARILHTLGLKQDNPDSCSTSCSVRICCSTK